MSNMELEELKRQGAEKLEWRALWCALEGENVDCSMGATQHAPREAEGSRKARMQRARREGMELASGGRARDGFALGARCPATSAKSRSRVRSTVQRG